MKKQLRKLCFYLGLLALVLITIQCTSEEEGSNGYTYLKSATQQEKEKKCEKITEENKEECNKISDELEENIKAAKLFAGITRGIIIDDDPRPCPEIGTCMPIPSLLRPVAFLDKDGISYNIRMLDMKNETIGESYSTSAPKGLLLYKFKLANANYLGAGKILITKQLKGKTLRAYEMDVDFVKQ